ncbi:GH25 family lysozyme [Limosilactobacillus oris]|uniref:GH25 family lysozyme n=1 Tax=Limosilactobacillus oris TaxID=1632 RepID=UPI0018847E9E|nr:GH25 family lysozyme [Limosilactobacillus oris]MBF0601145.1 KxYKxGKxW signal peptide domain-containing protein [Limosilactobacillus oris]
MEAKKRFKLYKSGKLWCCTAVAFGAMAFGTVNGQADDATPANTTIQISAVASQVATPAATTDSTTNATPESTVTAGTQTRGTAANDKMTAKNATAAATTTLNVQQASAAPVSANAVTTAAYAATNNLSTADTLDISAYQPNISEATFRQYHNQGINNVVVKLSESTSWTNAYAQQQVSRAQAAGMAVSAYHFVRFTTAAQAQQEAQLFARMARACGLGNDTLMIADVERVPQTQYAGIVNNLNVFWQTLSSLGFTNHGVYTGLYYDQQYNVSSTVGKARTWVAMYYYDYSANAARCNYIQSMGYGAWQYTDRWGGSIDGSIDFGMFSNYAGHQATSAANLENFNINANNNTLNVAGWFADNNNEGKNNRYVILLDQDNGNRELARQQVSAVSRPDVANVYSDVYGASNSGFNASFALNGSLADAIADGHRIQAIIRYTSSNDGNRDYNDHWFDGVVLNQNVANMEKLQVSQAGIHVSGWHAADQALDRQYHYVILFDATTKKEIARKRVDATNRGDVAKVYPNVYNSGKSGFSADFVMNDALRAALQNGDSIQVVSRYTDDKNGDGNRVDYWFTPQAYNQNQAYLEDFSIYNGQLRVTGWHASDQSVVEPNQWIILLDNQTGKEVARAKAITTKRNDVLAAYPNILNADNSGFVANFDIANTSGLRAAILAGHSLKAVARYSDDNGGEGHRSDYWFSAVQTPYSTQSAQELESFTINGNQIEASGWYADGRSVAAKAMYVILYDATTNRELGRQQIATADRERPDIASSNSSIANAGVSGFKASFAINNSSIMQALKNGDRLQVVARYTDDDQSGEGNYVQHFFDAQSFQNNNAYLDAFRVNSDGGIQVSGWHASNQTAGRPYHYVILYDATSGREITRQRVVENVQRPDVQKAYPSVYNSLNSGFNINFASSATIQRAISEGHNLQVIDRYSATKDDNGDYVDYWFAPRQLAQ